VSGLFEMLRDLGEAFLRSPELASLIGVAVAWALAVLASRGLYRLLQAIVGRVAPGPLFLAAALVVVLLYLPALSYLTWIGTTFEQGMIEWLTGVTDLPLEELGSYQSPLLFTLFHPALQLVYLVLVMIFAWLLGRFSAQPDSGGLAQVIESELGTSLAMRFYKLCGYHRPDRPEQRFVEWAAPIVRSLRWAKWLSFPAVLSGALPVALWVVGAIFIDGFRRTLAEPPAAPEEEEREEEAQAGALAAARDPNLLVHALRVDPRGPQLDVVGGGTMQGRAEHAAPRTRLADESAIMSDLLAALGIASFYVHQEAAADAILEGKDVLMETPPLSGRRTLCDVLAMREVLLDGGTVLYLSPTAEESARRARAFRRVAQASNWRWAIHHKDLALGREGMDLRLRQPQIVFATPEELHRDLCRLHEDWDYFLSSLALVVAIDIDRHTGPRGANLMFVMRRLLRVAKHARSEPRVLATVAPFGPDVQGFAERLVGRPLTVIGPESNSRGAPSQYVVVGVPRVAGSLHPAVSSRGVAIACGYQTEIWGHDEVLTELEQEQQVNQVLLEFSKAVVAPGEDVDLRFDDAHAIVVRLSSDRAAMIPFFTCHTGRAALGVAELSAEEVGGKRFEALDRPEIPFSGFQRPEEEAEPEVQMRDVAAAEADGAEEAVEVDEQGEVLAQALAAQPELAVAVWLPDDDSFAQLLAHHPGYVHPNTLHPMLRLGSRLVASADNVVTASRHLLCAAGEVAIERRLATSIFPAEAVARLERERKLAPRLRHRLTSEGLVEPVIELAVEPDAAPREPPGTTRVASDQSVRVVNRSGGEVVMETDRLRVLTAAYPGRVLVRGGRRYRVLLPDEQPEPIAEAVWAEPERRGLVTTRMRTLEVKYEGEGHELDLGGRLRVRLRQSAAAIEERVVGLRFRQKARGHDEALSYHQPVRASYGGAVAVVELPVASPAALEALERLVRITLPAFVRFEEEDLDVVAQAKEGRSLLCFVDRHPGGAGFARAVTSDVLRHALYWSREIVARCGTSARCKERDGCPTCVEGAPGLGPEQSAAPSRSEVLALLESLLGARGESSAA
jgi:ATP-dependent helicase YprA (DUF1998 family)